MRPMSVTSVACPWPTSSPRSTGCAPVNDPKTRARPVRAGQGPRHAGRLCSILPEGWLTKEELNTYCGDAHCLGASGIRLRELISPRVRSVRVVYGRGRRVGARLQHSPPRLRLAERCGMQRRLVWKPSCLPRTISWPTSSLSWTSMGNRRSLHRAGPVTPAARERWRAFGGRSRSGRP